jgi:hypothetical protein
MFKNRFTLILVALSMLLVTVALSRPFSKAPKTLGLSQPAELVILPATGAEEVRPYIMDSATRSYIAWGEAMRTRNVLDSGTRSYIAWGEALETAGKLHNSGGCLSSAQKNLFQGIDPTLDSATRSYIAWGLALQAKDDVRASCR